MDRSRFYAELMEYGRGRGFKPGWSAHVYRFRYGEFPHTEIADVAESIDCGVSDITMEWLEDYFAEMKRERQSKRQSTDMAIPSSRKKQLLSLCHPDKHPSERGELCHEVTCWLNSL